MARTGQSHVPKKRGLTTPGRKSLCLQEHLATILDRTMTGYAYEPVLLFRKDFRKG
jgi:hypothetical protein